METFVELKKDAECKICNEPFFKTDDDVAVGRRKGCNDHVFCLSCIKNVHADREDNRCICNRWMEKIEILIAYKHFSWLGFPAPGFMLYELREKFYTRWEQAYERVTTAEHRASLELQNIRNELIKKEPQYLKERQKSFHAAPKTFSFSRKYKNLANKVEELRTAYGNADLEHYKLKKEREKIAIKYECAMEAVKATAAITRIV